MNLLPENEFTEFEGRQYSNPQVGVDETNSFIDKFRNAQVQDTNKISADTQALGTNVPSQMGGLTGAKNYWTSRYQTPQTNSMVQDLRTTAQAQALNQVLANEQAKWKKRYQDAYNAYQKSAYDKANTPTTDPEELKGGVDEEETDGTSKVTYDSYVRAGAGERTFVDGAGNLHIIDENTGKETVIPPETTDSGSRNGYSGGGTGGGSGGGR